MVVKINRGIRQYEQLVSYGRKYTTVLDKLCAFLLAVSPILQHYKGLYENAGFTVLLIAFPILSLRLLTGKNRKGSSSGCLAAILPLIAFEFYTAIDHSATVPRILYIGFMIWIFLCVAFGCVNTAYFLKYATNIASLAAILLLVQYFSHYLLHHTLNLRPLSLLVSQDVIWVRHLKTASAGRLYRPAAFFLEPSHLFLYSFPILSVILLSPGMNEWRRNKAILITLAMLLSTSGFSIVICIGLWSLYFLIYKPGVGDSRRRIKKLFSAKNIFSFLVILFLLVIAYRFSPVFHRSVNRIFTSSEGTNAISGRIRLARNYISTISGKAVWFGASNVASTLEFNLAGFYATYIKWGIFGLFFTYLFYGRGLFSLKRQYFWMTFIIIVISFFTAHTHGTFYMLYYIVFLMNGYYEKKQEAAFEPLGS